MMSYYFAWQPYVSVADERRQAEREVAKLKKRGQAIAPVRIEGRKIAKSFWGQSWCTNLERYSDFENRLPRGRTYVRNGSVVDLQIAPGAVTALVSGSEVYTIHVKVTGVTKPRWSAVCRDCAGAIDSLVELLQGRFSRSVMERICHEKTGLFPSPAEIVFTCSCPDMASMCKHVAAVLYGIGARLDENPDLLFTLCNVNGQDLVARAGRDLPRAGKRPAAGKVLETGDLSEIFGIEMAQAAPLPLVARKAASSAKPAKRAKPARPRAAAPLAKSAAIAERMRAYWRARRKRAVGTEE